MASCDDVKKNTAFAEKNSADYPILSDPDKTIANAYGVLTAIGYPNRWTFYIDGAGKIAYIDKSVSAISAGDDIAARLAALGTPKRE